MYICAEGIRIEIYNPSLQLTEAQVTIKIDVGGWEAFLAFALKVPPGITPNTLLLLHIPNQLHPVPLPRACYHYTYPMYHEIVTDTNQGVEGEDLTLDR